MQQVAPGRTGGHSLVHSPSPPHGLVRQPASVTLLIASQVGGIELLWCGDAGSNPSTGFLGHRKGESIAGRALPVEKDDPWGQRALLSQVINQYADLP